MHVSSRSKSQKKCDSFCLGNGTFLQRPPAFSNEQNTSGAFEGFLHRHFPPSGEPLFQPLFQLCVLSKQKSTQKLVENKSSLVFKKKILSDNMLVVVTKMYWDWFFGDNPPRTFVSLRVPSIPPIGPIHGALPSISLGLAACQPWVHLDLNHRGWQLPQPLRVERCGFFGGAFFGWEIVAARSNKQTAKFGSFYCRYLHPHHVVFNIQKFWQFKTLFLPEARRNFIQILQPWDPWKVEKGIVCDHGCKPDSKHLFVRLLRNKQTNKQASRQAGRQADRQAGRQASRQAGRQAGKQASRQAGRQARRQASKQTNKQTNKQVGFLVGTRRKNWKSETIFEEQTVKSYFTWSATPNVSKSESSKLMDSWTQEGGCTVPSSWCPSKHELPLVLCSTTTSILSRFCSANTSHTTPTLWGAEDSGTDH